VKSYVELLYQNECLRKELWRVTLELQDERQKRSSDIDLLVKGEAIRGRMMLNAILDGVIPNCGSRVKL
jgi:hypothetical protein